MPPPPLAGGGSAAGGGGSTGLSYPPPSSCGQYTQSACLWAQYAAQSNWQATVQVTVDLRQLNAGGVLCHAGGTSLVVGPSLDGFSTLTMTSSPGGCFSSGGGGNSQVTGTATVYGASTTSLDGCASISCFDDGGGAAEKPTDGEAVSDSTGAGELAALMDDEGGNGGNEGKGPSVGGDAGDSLPQRAQQRADQIKQAMVSKYGWWFRKETTVGVAFMLGEEGLQEFVAINEGALVKWGEKVHALLEPGESWIEGSPAGKTHPEVLLVEHAQGSGLQIVGLGASTNFCETCSEMLQRLVGPEFLGQ